MRMQPEGRGRNLFQTDINLQRVLARLLGQLLERWTDTLSAYGAWVGDAVDRAAAYTDRHAPPMLKAYEADRSPRSPRLGRRTRRDGVGVDGPTIQAQAPLQRMTRSD